jgi:hypothetical protein
MKEPHLGKGAAGSGQRLERSIPRCADCGTAIADAGRPLHHGEDPALFAERDTGVVVWYDDSVLCIECARTWYEAGPGVQG